MKIKNISKKIIGLGDVVVLPNEEKTIPKAYENNPILEVYKKNGFATITGKTEAEKKADKAAKDAEKKAKEEAEKKAAEEAEALRQERLANLDKMSEEEVGAIAIEYGINPADCKDQKDVVKKVKAALGK